METWIESQSGLSRSSRFVSSTYARSISSLVRQSWPAGRCSVPVSCPFAVRTPFTSEYHSGWSLKCFAGGRIWKKEW